MYRYLPEGFEPVVIRTKFFEALVDQERVGEDSEMDVALPCYCFRSNFYQFYHRCCYCFYKPAARIRGYYCQIQTPQKDLSAA